MKRKLFIVFWRIVNPVVTPLSGFAPWWILLETTGNKTGRVRRKPVAMGIEEAGDILLLAAFGRRAGWVCNLEAEPQVRVKHRGRWTSGTASVETIDAAMLRRFNPYARLAGGSAAINPVLVRIRPAPRA